MKYSKPPIQEAVFDIRTQGVDFIGNNKLQDQLARSFDGYTRQGDIQNVNVDVKDRSARVERFGYRYASSNKKQIVTFRQDGFSFSRMSIYNGWEENYPEAIKLWQVYRKKLKPQLISRIATCFINKFYVLSTDVTSCFTTYIHQSQNSSVWDNMIYSLRSQDKQGIRSRTDFSAQKRDQGLDVTLTIDVFLDQLGMRCDDDNEIKNIFQNLRKAKNVLFESMITDKIREGIQ